MLVSVIDKLRQMSSNVCLLIKYSVLIIVLFCFFTTRQDVCVQLCVRPACLPACLLRPTREYALLCRELVCLYAHTCDMYDTPACSHRRMYHACIIFLSVVGFTPELTSKSLLLLPRASYFARRNLQLTNVCTMLPIQSISCELVWL